MSDLDLANALIRELDKYCYGVEITNVEAVPSRNRHVISVVATPVIVKNPQINLDGGHLKIDVFHDRIMEIIGRLGFDLGGYALCPTLGMDWYIVRTKEGGVEIRIVAAKEREKEGGN